MSGKCETFFKYMIDDWELFQFGAEVKHAIVAKKQTKLDVAEHCRASLVLSMKYGKQLVINLKSTVPFLKRDYDVKGTLPLKDMVFDRPKLVENHRQLLRDGEDEDRNKNKGRYVMDPEFNIIVLSDISDPLDEDETIRMVLEQLDHHEDFRKVYIREAEDETEW